MTTASLRYALIPLRYGSALRPEGSVAGLRAFGRLPPDTFLGSLNAASLFPVACSCWLVTAALWLLARHLFEEAL